jgi:hypothetical protein
VGHGLDAGDVHRADIVDVFEDRLELRGERAEVRLVEGEAPQLLDAQAYRDQLR